MFFLAATLVGWIGGDFLYKKVAAKNSSGGGGIVQTESAKGTSAAADTAPAVKPLVG